MTNPVWIVGDADGVTEPAHATQELAQDAAEAAYRKHNADIPTFTPEADLAGAPTRLALAAGRRRAHLPAGPAARRQRRHRQIASGTTAGRCEQSRPEESPMDEPCDITVTYRGGRTEVHENVTGDRVRELEDLAFTDPGVVLTKSTTAQRLAAPAA